MLMIRRKDEKERMEMEFREKLDHQRQQLEQELATASRTSCSPTNIQPRAGRHAESTRSRNSTKSQSSRLPKTATSVQSVEPVTTRPKRRKICQIDGVHERSPENASTESGDGTRDKTGERTDEGSNKAGSTHGNEFDVGEMIDDAIEELFNDS